MERFIYRPIMDFYGKNVEGLARLRYEDETYAGIEAYRDGKWVCDADVVRDEHEGYLGDEINADEAEQLKHVLDGPA